MRSTENKAIARDPTNVRRGKMLAWAVCQVVIPYFCVVIAWPMARVSKVDYAFEKSFIGADLLLLGAMLFIAIVVDIHIEKQRLSKLANRAVLDWYWYLTIFFFVIFLFLFAIIKNKAIAFDFPTVQNTTLPLDPTINWYVYASIFGGITAFVWSMAAGVHTNILYREAEIAELEADAKMLAEAREESQTK